MFIDRTNMARNNDFIEIRVNNSRGKRIYLISSLKFIKFSNDNCGFRCCKTYYIGKGEKHRLVYHDIFDDKEYDSMFVNFDCIYDFTDVVSEEELRSHEFVFTNKIIKEKIDLLNRQVVLKL